MRWCPQTNSTLDASNVVPRMLQSCQCRTYDRLRHNAEAEAATERAPLAAAAAARAAAAEAAQEQRRQQQAAGQGDAIAEVRKWPRLSTLLLHAEKADSPESPSRDGRGVQAIWAGQMHAL